MKREFTSGLASGLYTCTCLLFGPIDMMARSFSSLSRMRMPLYLYVYPTITGE